jgi:hypothetical protein
MVAKISPDGKGFFSSYATGAQLALFPCARERSFPAVEAVGGFT